MVTYKYECDKCKEEIIKEKKVNRLDIDINDGELSYRLDLCNECVAKLLIYIKKEK